MSIEVNAKNIGALGPINSQTSNRINKPGADAESFKNALQDQLDQAGSKDVLPKQALPKTLKFSNHAVDRMTQRGIHFSPEQMTKIEAAANKAAMKGAKETLIVTDDSALIVSLKDKTIVTVMDKTSLKENVFTNIASTVMV